VWSILNPLMMMGILSTIFTRVFRNSEPHFSIFVLIGLLIWQWFTSSVAAGTQMFVNNADIVKRTIFTRQLLPTVATLSYGINFCIESLVLLIFIPIFPSAFRLSPALLLLPVLFALLAILITGITLATSVLNVVYRDVGYLVNTALLILYWLTPVLYPIDAVPMPYRLALLANPVGAILNTTRRVIMAGEFPSAYAWCVMLIGPLIVFGCGWKVFREYEHMVLDYV